MPRVHVQERCAGSAAKILVAAADGEVDVERVHVDRQYAERMVDIQQHARASRVRGEDDPRQIGEPLAGREDHFGHDDEIGAPLDARDDVAGVEASVGARLDQRERDAAAASESNSPRVATTRGGASYVLSTARSPCPALARGITLSVRTPPSSDASRQRNAAISAFHASHAPPMRAYHAPTPSCTSSAIASSGRPSEWLAR